MLLLLIATLLGDWRYQRFASVPAAPAPVGAPLTRPASAGPAPPPASPAEGERPSADPPHGPPAPKPAPRKPRTIRVEASPRPMPWYPCSRVEKAILSHRYSPKALVTL
jgi:hypothetical protein